MKPETAAYLASAGEALADAQRILAIGIARQAARLACYAQFHAAQALIFEHTDRIAKTHRGVQSQFHMLAKADPAIDPRLAGDFSAAYHFKQAADYETGAAGTIMPTDAGDAIGAAQHFVAVIAKALSQTPFDPAP